MHLYELPLVFALVGLALYTVLGGADFGAGFWQLVAGKGEQADEIRDHAHDAMAPVWEANHVWLIFVLTVVWTAYPAAFGSIASTLSIPLFIAGLGIVLRGGAYALAPAPRPRANNGTSTPSSRSRRSSPRSRSAPPSAASPPSACRVGNPGGSIATSWLNPTSIAMGCSPSRAPPTWPRSS